MRYHINKASLYLLLSCTLMCEATLEFVIMTAYSQDPLFDPNDYDPIDSESDTQLDDQFANN